MSQQNVEIVRQIYERWGRGDFRPGMELYDRHVLFVLRPESPMPGPIAVWMRFGDTCARTFSLTWTAW
jgi:ketosteroid isomerase-like protein